MAGNELLFLGGLGVPAAAFTPWFAVFRWFGYSVRTVPNSVCAWDPVSRFAENLVRLSSGLESLDVLGVSYGGNAAVYAACLSPEFAAKVDRMVVICAPLLGAPGMLKPLKRFLPGSLPKTLEEMSRDSPISARIRDLGASGGIPFELHCVYHERDLMAPVERATLPGISKDHRLDFEWKAIPGLLMHQAACVNPKTLDLVIQILLGPKVRPNQNPPPPAG